MVDQISWGFLIVGVLGDFISLLRFLFHLANWLIRRRPGPYVGFPLLPLVFYAAFISMRQALDLDLRLDLVGALTVGHLLLQFFIPFVAMKTFQMAPPRRLE